MFVNALMEERRGDLVTVQADMPMAEAARRLTERKIGAVIVTDEAGEAIGILSERDIARAVGLHGEHAAALPVAAMMTRNLTTCATDDDLHKVMSLMNQHRVRHLPVRQDGRIVGMVSIRDVIEHLLDEVAGERDAIREYVAKAAC